MITVFVLLHPLSSITVSEYVPADKLSTVVPVCPLTLLLQFNVNGGIPLVMYAVIVPSEPLTVLVPFKIKSGFDDRSTKTVLVC